MIHLPHFAERLAARLDRPSSPPRASIGRPICPRGIDHPRAKHTDAEVQSAVGRVRAGEPIRLVAQSIGVARSTLSKWASGARRHEATLTIVEAAQSACEPACGLREARP